MHCCNSTATIVNANVPQWYVTRTLHFLRSVDG